MDGSSIDFPNFGINVLAPKNSIISCNVSFHKVWITGVVSEVASMNILISFCLCLVMQDSFTRAKKWVQELQKQGAYIWLLLLCAAWEECRFDGISWVDLSFDIRQQYMVWDLFVVIFVSLCVLMSWPAFSTFAGNPNMVVALAGNKCDLEDKRNVTAEVSILFLYGCSYLLKYWFSISLTSLWYCMLPYDSVFYNVDYEFE